MQSLGQRTGEWHALATAKDLTCIGTVEFADGEFRFITEEDDGTITTERDSNSAGDNYNILTLSPTFRIMLKGLDPAKTIV